MLSRYPYKITPEASGELAPSRGICASPRPVANRNQSRLAWDIHHSTRRPLINHHVFTVQLKYVRGNARSHTILQNKANMSQVSTIVCISPDPSIHIEGTEDGEEGNCVLKVRWRR